MNFSRVQNTVSSNTLVLLSVAVTESGDSSFVVNNKGSNKKTLYMNSTKVYMCIYATDIVYINSILLETHAKQSVSYTHLTLPTIVGV